VRGIDGQSRSMPFNASGVRSEYPHGGRIQALGRRTHRRTPCSFGICCGLSRFAPRNVPHHPACATARHPPEPPPLGGRGSRRAVPLPQPNSVTSVASVVKKKYHGSAGASPSRRQPDCRVSLRETCRIAPPVPPPALPRTAPPSAGEPSRRAVPLPQLNSVASVASVVKKRTPRLSRSFALPRSFFAAQKRRR